MRNTVLGICALLGVLAVNSPSLLAQEDNTESPQEQLKADAYYHFALGHLYAELVNTYGNKGNFVDKAIDNYRQAMEADPAASFLSEELSDLYIQAGRLREAVLDSEEALRENPNDLSARRILARIYIRLIGDPNRNEVHEEMVKKALEQYEKIAELQPGDDEVWMMLGRLHKLDHDSVAAEAAYKKVLEIDPGHEDALVGLAMVYADLGDNPRAAEMLRKVVAKDPSVRTLTFLANTYERMNEHELASQTYRRAITLAPKNTELKRAYAQSLLMSDETDEAQKAFEEIVAENAEDADAQLRLSQIYRQKGRLADARKALDVALKASPDNLEVLYNNVNMLEAEGQTGKAIAALKEILESTRRVSYSTGERANRAVFLERLGLMYRSMDQIEEAVNSFRELEALDPDKAPRARAQIADIYRQDKDFDKAREVINKAHQDFPDDRMVAIIRATILADAGDADEAIAAVRALTKGKKDRESYLAKAQIYEKTKRFDLLAAALDRAQELSKTKAERATVLFMRGAMYERQKRFEESEAAFREVLRLSPDNSSAMNYLGYMFADRGVKLKEAYQLISKALEYEPNNGAYLDSLGWVLFRMQKVEEAETQLRRAAALVARDPVVHDHLGDVYFKLGKLREAISHWKLSLKEWNASAAGEKDPTQIAKVQEKLEGAEVRLARELDARAPEKNQP